MLLCAHAGDGIQICQAHALDLRLDHALNALFHAVGEDAHDAQHLGACLAQRRDRIQHAAAGGDEVLDHDDPLPRLEPALNLIFSAVVLAARAHIAHGQAEQMRGDGGVGDARRGGAHQNLRLRKLTVYCVRNGALDCLTHGGGGENEAVIAIDRAFDAARPGKRLLRAQKDRADGEQALSDPAADVHIHVPPVVFYS